MDTESVPLRKVNYLALVRVVIYWPRKTGSVFCRGTELSTVLVKKIVTK